MHNIINHMIMWIIPLYIVTYFSYFDLLETFSMAIVNLWNPNYKHLICNWSNNKQFVSDATTTNERKLGLSTPSIIWLTGPYFIRKMACIYLARLKIRLSFFTIFRHQLFSQGNALFVVLDIVVNNRSVVRLFRINGGVLRIFWINQILSSVLRPLVTDIEMDIIFAEDADVAYFQPMTFALQFQMHEYNLTVRKLDQLGKTIYVRHASIIIIYILQWYIILYWVLRE